VIERGLRLGEEKIERDLQPFKEARDESVFLREQGVKKMFYIDGLIAKARRFVLGGAKGGGSSFGKFV